MVSQKEVDIMSSEISWQKRNIKELEKLTISLNKKHKERGKSINKLWEKEKELKKEIVTLQKYCGKLTFDLSKLQLENRIIVESANKIGCEPKQFLVRDIVRQLIKEAGYDLEFKVLQKKSFGPVDLTITGKEVKK